MRRFSCSKPPDSVSRSSEDPERSPESPLLGVVDQPNQQSDRPLPHFRRLIPYVLHECEKTNSLPASHRADAHHVMEEHVELPHISKLFRCDLPREPPLGFGWLVGGICIPIQWTGS